MDVFTFMGFCIGILLAKSVDPDQMPPSAASELGLHEMSIQSKKGRYS